MSSILLTSVIATGLSQQAFADTGISTLVSKVFPGTLPEVGFFLIINDPDKIQSVSLTTLSGTPVNSLFTTFDSCKDKTWFDSGFRTETGLIVTVTDCQDTPSTDEHIVFLIPDVDGDGIQTT